MREIVNIPSWMKKHLFKDRASYPSCNGYIVIRDGYIFYHVARAMYVMPYPHDDIDKSKIYVIDDCYSISRSKRSLNSTR